MRAIQYWTTRLDLSLNSSVGISEITPSKFMPLDVGHTYVSVTLSFEGSVFSILDLDCERFDLQYIKEVTLNVVNK